METKMVKLYPFSELMTKSQQKVLNRHRYWNTDGITWNDEILSRFKKDMLETFGIEVGYVYFDFEYNRGCFTTKKNVDLIKFKQATVRLQNWNDEQLKELSEYYSPSFNIDHVRVVNGIGEMRIYVNPHITDKYLAWICSECEKEILELCKDRASDLLCELKKEFEFQTSDEQVAASIISNGITFFMNGDEFKEEYER